MDCRPGGFRRRLIGSLLAATFCTVIALHRQIMPTQRADALSVKVDQILRNVDDALVETPTFDPTKSTREFNLMLTDYGEMVLLPTLMEKLEKLAATVRINACAHNHADVREALRFGKVDFYLWTTPIGEKGFSSHLVSTEELWCLVRKDSRLKKLILEQYLKLLHIAMDWPTWQGRRPIEHYLDDHGLSRINFLCVHTFFDMPAVVARTGMVSTMPCAWPRASRRYIACNASRFPSRDCPYHSLDLA